MRVIRDVTKKQIITTKQKLFIKHFDLCNTSSEELVEIIQRRRGRVRAVTRVQHKTVQGRVEKDPKTETRQEAVSYDIMDTK